MVTLNAFGSSSDLFTDAFSDLELVSISPTRLVLRNPENGYVTTATGTGFATDNSKPSGVRGTINSAEITTFDGTRVYSITGANWEVNRFDAAIEADRNGNEAPLLTLLSQNPLTVNGSSATGGMDFDLTGITSNATILGSNFQDTLRGGAGNDRITPGASDDGELIYASEGNDTINFAGHSSNGWAQISYEDLTRPVTIMVNGAGNFASVTKDPGVDTILDVQRVLNAGGLNLTGTAADDVFVLDAGSDLWMAAAGGAGDDRFDLTLSGTIRLNYNFGPGTRTSGINANLVTGKINDGFGGTDTLNITAGAGRLELRASDLNDIILGSDADEGFILRAGTDTLDAGGGFDVLRYDRSGVSAVEIDVGAGRATGQWNGRAFDHTFANVEEVRGSYENDRITGSAGDDRLHGSSGDDSLYGGEGDDRLYGGTGDDYLNPGDNTGYDELNPHSGNDTVDASEIVNGFLEVQHYDLAGRGAQVFDIDGRTNSATISKGPGDGTTTILNVVNPMDGGGLALRGSHGDDIFNITLTDRGWTALIGGRGNDSFNIGTTEFGTVRLDFSNDGQYDAAFQGLDINLATGVVANDGFGGRDTVNGAGNARIEVLGTDQDDTIIGSDQDDRFITEAGNDTVHGGAGRDLVRYDRNSIDSGVRVDLDAGIASGLWNGAFTDRLIDIEDVRGTRSFDDVLSGSSAANYLAGLGGNDHLYGDGFDVSLSGPLSGQVYRMYQATLGRAPDAAGHEGWTMRLFEGDIDLGGLARGFVNSPEFKATYGALDNDAFIELLYRNVLGRAADAGGKQNWLDAIADGSSRTDVVIGFSESREFKGSTAAAAGDFAKAHSEAAWTDEIYRVYQATLDRAPDLGGFKNWAELLGSGAGFDTMIGGFVNSPEFKNTYGALNNDGFVQLLYQNVLGRAGDAGGVSGWTDVLEGGGSRASVVRGFSQSPEFIAGTAADVKSWVAAQGVQDVLDGGDGNDVMMGGILADQFVFRAADKGGNTVVDLEAWDIARFEGFGYGTDADVRSHMAQQNANVVFLDQGVSATFLNTQLADITDDMIQI